MINPKNLKKSILDYAIRGELSAKYRRENQTAVASNTISGSLNDENHHPNCHCETCQKASRGNLLAMENAPNNTATSTVIASEQSERGNLLTTENAPNLHSDKGIATTATQSRNDGVLTAFDEIAAYNAKITQIKGQRETLLLQIEKQLKAEKGTKRKKDTVIASEQSERGNLLTMENAPNNTAALNGHCETCQKASRGNLPTTESQANDYNDKGIATTATQSRNDGFPTQEVLSGSTKTPEQRTEQLKRISGSLKNKIKTYRTITPLNQNPEFTPPFDIPKEWAWVSLNQVVKFIDYRGKTPHKTSSGVFLITASNIKQGYMDYTRQEYISNEEYQDRQSRGITRKGDLLFTTEAPMGNVAICDLDICSCGQRVITFQKYTDSLIYLKLLMYFILSPQFQQQLLDNSTGTTAKGIKAENLKNIPIPLPPLAEQQFIAGQLEKLLDLCKKLKTKP